MSGTQAVLEMLLAEGGVYIFGNPGTTELPLMDALQDYPQLRYLLALQEGVAVGMADGYARASRKPAFVNLHVAPGLANGLSMLYDAWKGGTPLVLTAGQVDTRTLIQEPTGLAGDLVEMCRQYSKWSYQPTAPEALPLALRRAFKTAIAPPSGPTFLSLATDVLNAEADVEIVPSTQGYFSIRPDEAALGRAAHMLASAERPLILVGDRVAQSGAVAEAVAIAEVLGARVFGINSSEVNFPTGHSQYLGTLVGRSLASLQSAIDSATAVLVAGATVPSHLLGDAWDASRLVRSKQAIHLDCTPWEIEKNYPIGVGLWADIKTGLADLTAAVQEVMSGTAREAAAIRAREISGEKEAQRRAFQEAARRLWNQTPISNERLMSELRDVLPPASVIAEEALTSRTALHGAFEFNQPGSFFSFRGAGLGWLMPGALGVKLGKPTQPVVAVVGDGATMYSIQALWTAHAYNIPVVYVVCNNRSYRILKENIHHLHQSLGITGRKSEYIGMDFMQHPPDLPRIAEAFGIWSTQVSDPGDLRPVLEKALGLGKPALVDVLIHPGDFR